jgi:hypothetical protein
MWEMFKITEIVEKVFIQTEAIFSISLQNENCDTTTEVSRHVSD